MSNATEAVSLWLSNDEGMYELTCRAADLAGDNADRFRAMLQDNFTGFDFDGYTITNRDIDWSDLLDQFKEDSE